ncbi:MAG: response regulator [Elusimicrobiota bacterium]
MTNRRILIIDDEQTIIDLLEVNLKNSGYDVFSSTDGLNVVEKVEETNPDLVILDLMLPGISGYEICSKLKEKEETSFIPILILSAKDKPLDKIKGLKLGADEYVTKPFDVDEVITRIDTLLKRTEHFLSVNPLTHLPGNTSIMYEATKRLRTEKGFAFSYADINNFKAFNDKYGFDLGDMIIKFTARILHDNINKSDFIGHIGGDDFIIICSHEKVEDICQNIIDEFDTKIPDYYENDDKNNGYIISQDRAGNTQKFPIMTLSIGVVMVDRKRMEHYGNIVDIATQMKKYAKLNGPVDRSYYAIDKRNGVK